MRDDLLPYGELVSGLLALIGAVMLAFLLGRALFS
jgi:hypothetical protein